LTGCVAFQLSAAYAFNKWHKLAPLEFPMTSERATMDEEITTPMKPNNNWRDKIGFYAIIVILAFLVGLVPMWLNSRKYAAERDVAQSELRLAQLQNFLASAAIDARRGEYEPARQNASNFFTVINAEMNSSNSLFNTAQRENIALLMSQRDDLITLLARGDPAAAERLTDFYVAYRKTFEPPTQQK